MSWQRRERKLTGAHIYLLLRRSHGAHEGVLLTKLVCHSAAVASVWAVTGLERTATRTNEKFQVSGIAGRRAADRNQDRAKKVE